MQICGYVLQRSSSLLQARRWKKGHNATRTHDPQALMHFSFLWLPWWLLVTPAAGGCRFDSIPGKLVKREPETPAHAEGWQTELSQVCLIQRH